MILIPEVRLFSSAWRRSRLQPARRPAKHVRGNRVLATRISERVHLASVVRWSRQEGLQQSRIPTMRRSLMGCLMLSGCFIGSLMRPEYIHLDPGLLPAL